MRYPLLPLLILSVALTGCPKNPPAPLEPGATSQFDQYAYRTLVTIHAFVQQAASDPSTFTPAQKALVNQAIVDVNAADELYKSYHAGLISQAQMQAAIDKATTDQANFTAAAGVK